MMLSLPTWPLKEQLRFGQQRYRDLSERPSERPRLQLLRGVPTACFLDPIWTLFYENSGTFKRIKL